MNEPPEDKEVVAASASGDTLLSSLERVNTADDLLIA